MNTEEMQDYYRSFNKIKLWNEITNQILNFGIQYTNPSLADYVDMNCGGIPEGDFEQVVDLNAPQQFICMYMSIVENRFAFVVSALLSVTKDFLTPIQNFCQTVGTGLNVKNIDTIEKAEKIMKDFLLDGNHKEAWEKANGDLAVFYNLEEFFLNGLFSESNFSASVSSTGDIKLKKENKQTTHSAVT